MFVVPCNACYTAVRVMGEPDRVSAMIGKNSEYADRGYICVSCGSKCGGLEEDEIDLSLLQKMKLRDLSPEEMLAAQEGLGTPEEMLCTGATVRDLLKAPIKKVHGFDIPGTTRFCVDMLELEDGTKLHLGSSPSGAVVYRIVRPFSYTQKALEECGG